MAGVKISAIARSTQSQKRMAFDFCGFSNWEKQVACRYVDDCIAISHFYCSFCLHIFFQSKSNAQFELQNSDPLHATWIDLECCVTERQLDIEISHPEHRWIRGLEGEPKKFRMAPSRGFAPHDAKVRIRNMQARLMQVYSGPVRPGLEHALGALHSAMNIWFRSGYSENMVFSPSGRDTCPMPRWQPWQNGGEDRLDFCFVFLACFL